MKICAISDVHGHLINIPECDVLCIAGDVVNLLAQRDNEESDKFWSITFVNWVDKLPCKKVIVVPGNHDIYIENLINDTVKNLSWQDFKIKMSALTNDKVVFLVDELYEYEGITFMELLGQLLYIGKHGHLKIFRMNMMSIYVHMKRYKIVIY